MAKIHVPIQRSETRSARVLLVDSDSNRASGFERRSELDQRYQRMSLFTSSSLEEARSAARKHGCDLAVIVDNLSNSDFVNTYIEIKNAQPEIESIFIVSVPTIAQLKTLRDIDSTSDFADTASILDFDSFTDLILNHYRNKSRSTYSRREIFSKTETIQTSLLLDRKELSSIKKRSAAITEALSLHFDLTPNESSRLIACEQIYFPNLSNDDYAFLLKDDEFSLLPILVATGSWGSPSRQPNSAEGFIITAANRIADLIEKHASREEILVEFKSRPKYLLHPSIRVVTDEIIRAVSGKNPSFKDAMSS